MPKRIVIFTVGIQGTYREFLIDKSAELADMQKVFANKRFGYSNRYLEFGENNLIEEVRNRVNGTTIIEKTSIFDLLKSEPCPLTTTISYIHIQDKDIS